MIFLNTVSGKNFLYAKYFTVSLWSQFLEPSSILFGDGRTGSVSEVRASPLADLTLTWRHQILSRLAVEIAKHHTTQWNPNHWVLVLNSISLSSEAQIALLHPLKAIAAAFEIKRTHNLHVKELALREYQIGLRIQRYHLQGIKYATWSLPRQGTSKDLLLFLSLMGMLLLEFEMMAPSGPDSWIPHARGMMIVFGLIGPRASQQSPFFEMFTLLRFIYVSVCSNKGLKGY